MSETNGKNHTNGKVKKIKRPRKLTLKQKLFIKHYSKTGNITEAAKAVGLKCPSSQGSRLLNIVKGHDEFQKLMNKSGLSDNQLLKKMKEATEATKTATANCFIVFLGSLPANSESFEHFEPCFTESSSTS